MRILLTGSSGFIGTSFLEARSGHDELHGVDRRPPLEPVEGVDYHVADLCDSDRVSSLVQRISPEVVIHLAAQARVEPSFEDPVGTYRDNVVATIHLIRAALQLGTDFKTFVYASSETVYRSRDRLSYARNRLPEPSIPLRGVEGRRRDAGPECIRRSRPDRSERHGVRSP